METERSYSLSEGLVAGLLGYATVVILIGALDLLLGRSLFYTPAMLGRGLVADPGPPGTIAAGSVLAYNGVHLLVFLLIGIAVVRLARFVELHPVAWYLAFFALVFGFFVAELMFTAIDPEGSVIAWWLVLAGTAAAAFAMGFFVNHRHPGLRRRVQEQQQGA